MRKYIILSLLAVSICQTMGANGRQAGSELALADPCVLLDDGVYYAYGTYSPDGILVYQSEDLRTWKPCGHALHKSNTTENQKFWAPEVVKRNGQYYMYYSANERLYVAVSQSPLGPFRQVAGPMLDEGSIDGSPFLDDDGKWYFFLVRFRKGNQIWVARMTDDGLGLQKETLHLCVSAEDEWEKDDAHFPGCRVAEGPNVWKHDGRYYLTYSANHYQSHKYGVGVAVSENILGSWKKVSYNPLLQQSFGLSGTGHHGLFFDKKGHLMMMFHAHKSAQSVHPRMSYIVRMKSHKLKDGTRKLGIGRRLIVPRVQH